MIGKRVSRITLQAILRNTTQLTFFRDRCYVENPKNRKEAFIGFIHKGYCMPSREMRRVTRKRGAGKETTVEKKRKRHPFLYGFSVIILIVIVVTFVGGPALSRAGRKGTLTFGYYDGKPVEFFPGNYFSRQKDLAAEGLSGSEANDEVEVQIYKVWRTAFDQTILHMAIMAEAEKSGIWVSEDGVDRALIASGPYMVDGQFSEERYNRTPSAERFVTRKLFREQILHEQYLKDIFNNQHAGNPEIEFFQAMVETQRKLSFITYAFSDYPDKEIWAYGEKNKDRFRKIKLSRILIKSSNNEAQEIKKKLEERTSSFEELARAHSKGLFADKGGDMGWRYFYDLEGDFDTTEPVEEIFRLNEGEISPVLTTRFGWVIYRCDTPALELDVELKAVSASAAEDVSLPEPDSLEAETIQIITDYVMKYEKGMVEDYFFELAMSFAERAEEVGFLLAALQEGLPLLSTDYFPLNYQGIYFMAPVRSTDESVNISSASYNREFFEAAFSLFPGQISVPVLLDDQVLVLALEDERKSPEQEADFIDDYYQYIANQSLQSDMQTVLIDPNRLEDNFNTVFYQYVVPRP